MATFFKVTDVALGEMWVNPDHVLCVRAAQQKGALLTLDNGSTITIEEELTTVLEAIRRESVHTQVVAEMAA
jgi:uncharacterized protein YlzI (FlbEa/FlbD family)